MSGIRLNEMVAGDTWDFTTYAPDYPAPTWTLTLRLVPRDAGGSVIEITSIPEGEGHRFVAAKGVTAAYAAGYYSYWTLAGDGAQRFTLDGTEWTGELRIFPDPATLNAGFDGRSAATRALAQAWSAYHDAVDRRASLGAQAQVEEYEIGNRRMKYVNAQTAIDSLVAMIKNLEIEVSRERRADAIRRGMADPRKVYVRMGNG